MTPEHEPPPNAARAPKTPDAHEARKANDANDANDEWSAPKPEVIVRSTYFPAAMAFGITLLLWGLVASPVVLVAGGTVIAVSLVGWIGEMRHEQ